MKSVLALALSLLVATPQLAASAAFPDHPARAPLAGETAPAVMLAQQGVLRAGGSGRPGGVNRPGGPPPSGAHRPGRPPVSGVHRPGRPPHSGIYRPGRPRPPGVRPPPGGWVRPPSYWWHPGTAVAAGVAMGVVAASVASRWAGPPPAPGYCWFHTDPARSNGFWDVCP